jgi:adenylate cyclase, class 2
MMAFDGIEIEVRTSADPATAEAIASRLLANGGARVHHRDTYFDNVSDSFISDDPIRTWLSVRERGQRTLINHKSFHFDNNVVATHCDEIDVPVESADAARLLLTTLGFTPLVTVEKWRTEGVVDGTYQVAVDVVRDLGAFVEVEALGALGSIRETRARLVAFLSDELGLDFSKLDEAGYPHLLLEQSRGG